MWRKYITGAVILGWMGLAQVAQAQTVNINNTLSPPATTLQNAVTANGNGTSVVTTGYGSLLLDVTCTTCSGGTLVNFEESADNSVWTAAYAYQVGTTGTIAATTTATGMYQVPLGGGVRSVRARVSAYSAGTVTVKGYLGVPTFAFPGINANILGSVTAIQSTGSNLKVEASNNGTFATQSAQSGTWNITNVSGTVSLPTGAATAAKQPALGTAGISSTDVISVQGIASGTALPISAASLPLPSTASTSTKQSDGSQKTQIVDGSGNVIAATSNALNVQCANCSGSGVVTADEAAFTAGTSSFAGAGGFFQTTATNNALTNGQQGMFQATANRAIFSNLRNAAGTEVGTSTTPLQVSLANTAANSTAVKVDGSAVTQPVSGTVTANAGSGSFSVVGTGIAGAPAGSILTVQGAASMTKLLVTPDSVALPANQSVNVAQVGGTNTVNAGVSGVIAVGGNVANAVTATANPVPVGGVFVTTPATLTTGQTATMQFTAAQNMKNDLTTIAGTASAVNSGNKDNGTMRVVIATDQPALTNKLLVTPDLPALAATSTKQSDGTQKTQIVDGSGNVIASTSNNLNVQCANCSGTGVSAQDEASFTAGTSLLAPNGGFFQTTATNNALTNGQQGMLQMTAQRAAFSNLRNASGTEIGTSTTPVQVSLANTGANSNKLLVTPDSVALPANQSVNVNQLAGTTTDTNSGTKSAGTLRVVLATDQPALTNKLLVTPDSVALPANQSVNVSQVAGTTTSVNIGASDAGSQRVVLSYDGNVTLQASQVSATTNTTTSRTTTTGLGPYTDLSVLINITNAGAATGTLNLYLQDSCDSGTTWNDLISSNAFTFGAATTTQLFWVAGKLATSNTQGAAAVQETLAAGTARQGPFCDRIRVREKVSGVSGSPTGVTYTITGVAKR